MGHRKTHAPKHGSLAYLPRKRAKKPTARIRFWPKIKSDSPKLLGFSAYKAGMTYVFTIEDRKRSPNFGKEVVRAVTNTRSPEPRASPCRDLLLRPAETGGPPPA